MVRRASLAVCLTAALVLAFGAAFPTAAPIRLARHPDYHEGKVVFSYLGDIWMANEDGSNVHRLTDNLAREMYPRFSPDGQFDRVLLQSLRQQRRLRHRRRPAARRGG